MLAWVEGDAFVLLRYDLFTLMYDVGHLSFAKWNADHWGCQLHGEVLEKLIVYQIAQKTIVFKEPKSALVQNTGAS
jgi:hypothetical protein